MWEEMEVGEEQRRDFAPFAVPPEAYCDDLLAVHEQEVRRTPRTAIAVGGVDH
jgi:hypothetical protein